MTVASILTELAAAFRDLLQTNDKMKLEDMPAKVYDVYGKGSNDGYNGGLAEGIEEGKQAEYDRFWDNFQQNGNRKEYRYAFGGDGWTKETFKPKYDLKPTSAQQMFAGFSTVYEKTSIAECLEQAGVILDTSNSTNCQQMFYACRSVEIPNINLGSATNASNLFYDALYLKKVEITVPESCPLTVYSNWFGGCKELEDLTVNGVLKYSLDLSKSTKLTKDSIDSVLYALANNPTSVQTLTLSATAVNAVYTPEQWEILVATFAPNWSLVLA